MDCLTAVDRPTTDPRSTVDARIPPTDLPALIPVPTAAALLNLSRAAAYRYAAAGTLPTKRFGRRVYVITKRIRELLDDPVALDAGGEAA
jgi:predicted DNA-binding transcriptional regulator AlpA